MRASNCSGRQTAEPWQELTPRTALLRVLGRARTSFAGMARSYRWYFSSAAASGVRLGLQTLRYLGAIDGQCMIGFHYNYTLFTALLKPIPCI
jgi:hypothetical protein